jgi:hypothetical protein
MTQSYALKPIGQSTDTDESQDCITDNENTMNTFNTLQRIASSAGLWVVLMQSVSAQVANVPGLNLQLPPAGAVQSPPAQRANGQGVWVIDENGQLQPTQPEAPRTLPYGSGYESRQSSGVAKSSGASGGSGRGRGR